MLQRMKGNKGRVRRKLYAATPNSADTMSPRSSRSIRQENWICKIQCRRLCCHHQIRFSGRTNKIFYI
ncbi:hypothetical protein DPMN_187598 [Dreissena polymorpha]|uniref:Uncharacterized protein n=1 Tax=Dreissena polymorpha TaxID=45954 RepID=A0A9D4DQI8_DREPO|nr:hypothetical protein DPMN_187598 [Dreissena polymorpha]